MASSNQYGSKAIQIASFLNTEKKLFPIIYSDRIHEIIRNNGVEDLPIVVMSVAGVSRSGKSFLLNLIIDYIKFLSTQSSGISWAETESEISGLQWAVGGQAVTYGMWMWEKAFVLPWKNGSKYALLLVDTQGVGDNVNSVDPTIDTLIMYTSLELSTLQIFNVMKYWRTEDQKSLKMCKDYASMISSGDENQSGAIFRSLLVLYRDWQNDEDFGYRPDLLRKHRETARTSDSANSLMESIESTFKHVCVFAFDEPGKKAKKAKNVISKTDIDDEFLAQVQEFCSKILGPDGSLEDIITDAWNGRNFYQKAEKLRFRLEDPDLPTLKDPMDFLHDCILNKAQEAAQELLQKEIEILQRSGGLDSSEALQNQSERIRQDVRRKFDTESAKARTSQACRTYRHRLEDYMKQRFESEQFRIEWKSDFLKTALAAQNKSQEELKAVIEGKLKALTEEQNRLREVSKRKPYNPPPAEPEKESGWTTTLKTIRDLLPFVKEMVSAYSANKKSPEPETSQPKQTGRTQYIVLRPASSIKSSPSQHATDTPPSGDSGASGLKADSTD